MNDNTPPQYVGRRPLFILALVLLAALSSAEYTSRGLGVRMVDAIPFHVSDVSIAGSLTVGGAVDSVLLERVTLTNGAELRLDVSAMLPGAINMELNDCVCGGGSQIYVLGYRGEAVPPAERRLSVSVRGLQATSCSLVVAYRLPDATSVTIMESSIATTEPIGYAAMWGNGMEDAVAPPLALCDVALAGGGSVRVVNTTLATTVAGGMAVYLGGSVALEHSALVLDNVQLSATLGPDSYAVYASPQGSLSLMDGSLLSLTTVDMASAAHGVSIASGLVASASVVRLVKCIGSMPLPVVNIGGQVTNGGWVLLSWIQSALKTSIVANLSSLILDGADVSMVRCVASGSQLAVGPTLTSGNVYVQCNRAGFKTLGTTGDYNTAGMSSVIVKSCAGCYEETSCFGALTASLSDCECVCSSGGVGPQCLPLAAPTPEISSSGGTYCLNDVTVTNSMSLGTGLQTLCFERVVFTGKVSVTVDLAAMDIFADVLSVSLTDCVMDGGSMIVVAGSATGTELPPASVVILNMTARDGTIAFRNALPSKSGVRVENSTLFSTSANSQYVPTTTGETTRKYGPVLVLSAVQLIDSEFTVTRTSMECAGMSGYSCAVILIEYGLVLSSSSRFYMDNADLRCPNWCMNFIASAWTIEGGSAVSVQNSTWIVRSSGEWTTNPSSLTVSQSSVLAFLDNTLTVPYCLMYSGVGKLLDGSWLVMNRNRIGSFYGLRFSSSLNLNGGSIFSIFGNALVPHTYSSSSNRLLYVAYSNQGGTMDVTSFTYGGCNTLLSSLVASGSYSTIGLGSISEVYDCGVCTKTASCFNAKATSINGCECACSTGGYGPLCLPAPVPTGLGPLPQNGETPADVSCVVGGSLPSVTLPSGSSGVCFVDVTFTAAITLDLSYLSSNAERYNVTLLRCTLLSSFTIQGVSASPATVSLTAIEMSSGTLTLSGAFGDFSEISIVDSRFYSTSTYAITLGSSLSLGTHSTALVYRCVFGPNAATAGLYSASTFTLTNSSFVIDSNTFTLSGSSASSSPLRLYYLYMYNQSTLAFTRNTINAVSGIYTFFSTSITDSVILLADNTMTGTSSSSQLAYLYDHVYLIGVGEFRVVNNTMATATLIYYAGASYKMNFRAGSPGLIIVDNTVTGTTRAAISLQTSQFMLSDGQERIYVRCNAQNGNGIAYTAFPASTTVLECGACQEDVACYGPGTAVFSSGTCGCDCGASGGYGEHCYLYDIPDIPETVIPEPEVDQSTSCVQGGTVTDTSGVNRWKTHHCYVGVTFSGSGAQLTFTFKSMPLSLPINITLVDCTLTSYAAVSLVGPDTPMESSGVTITLSRLTVNNGCILLANTLPKGTSVSITEVSGLQSANTNLAAVGYSNSFSTVFMYSFSMSGSSLLISNVNTKTTSGGYMFYLNGGSPRFENSSSVHIRYNTVSEYNDMLYVNADLVITGGSVLSLNNNTCSSLMDMLYLYWDIKVESGSVFRFFGNSGIGVSRGAVTSFGSIIVSGGSWLDMRGNTFTSAALLYYMSSYYTYSIDATSTVTMTSNDGAAILRAGFPMFNSLTSGYTLVVGCMTVGGEAVMTAEELQAKGMTQQTRVAECETCAMDTNCFQELTTGITESCECTCMSGGHGDMCLPAIIPDGPPPPPPPPTPPPPPDLPAPGECVANMVYPTTIQTVGADASWLCYRNVTFTGSGMTYTVNTGQLNGGTSGVVNITFTECTWTDGALLDFNGGTNANVTALNILISSCKHTNSGLSFRNTFPAYTNITITGSTFSSSQAFAHGGTSATLTHAITGFPGLTLRKSLFVVSGCTFTGTASSSYALYFAENGLVLREKSLFVVQGSELSRTSGYLLGAAGTSSTDSVSLWGNSTVAIRSNRAVATTLTYFVNVVWVISLSDASVFAVEDNVVVAQRLVFLYDDVTITGGSYFKVSGNTVSIPVSSGAVVYCYYGIRMDASSYSVITSNAVRYDGSVSSTSGKVFFISYFRATVNAGPVVLKCNTLNDQAASYPSIPSAQNADERDCSSACALEEVCVPAYTESLDAANCTCFCTTGGEDGACMPAALPPVPQQSGGMSDCISGVNVLLPTNAALGSTSLCYQQAVFGADVLISLGTMANRPLNVTFASSTFASGSSLSVSGTVKSNNPLTLLVRGCSFVGGAGMVLAGMLPSNSLVTVVDTTFSANTETQFRSEYNTWPLVGVLLFYNVTLASNSVLSVARTSVTGVFSEARGILFYNGLALSGGSAVYLDGVAVETMASPGVAFENGEVRVSEGSVFSLIGSTFLLCSNALHVGSALYVDGASVVEIAGNTFASVLDYAVRLTGSAASFGGMSLLLVKENECSGTKELLAVDATVQLMDSTLSFAGNTVLASRLVSMGVTLDSTSHLRVACNKAREKNLTTESDYGSAGFGDTGVLDISVCGVCDVNAYCDASGALSASAAGESEDMCVCVCKGSRGGGSCAPVGPSELPPMPDNPGTAAEFTLTDATVESPPLIPNGVESVTLQRVRVTGVQLRLYTPWMAESAVRVIVEDVTLRGGAALYVLGGSGGRVSTTQSLQLRMCGLMAVNGALVFSGLFPAESAISVTGSTFVMLEAAPLPYLGSAVLADYAPAVVLSGLRLVRSVLIMYDVQILSVVAGGRAIVAEGSQLVLEGSGLALDSLTVGAAYTLYVPGVSVLSAGSVLRVRDSALYGGRGVALAQGVKAEDSVVAVNGNTAVLSAGPLLAVMTTATFTRSWLSVRDDACSGGNSVVALPAGSKGLVADGGAYSLFNVSGEGSVLMEGSVNIVVSIDYAAGCLWLNGVQLMAFEYTGAGVRGAKLTLGCEGCDEAVYCFAPLTKSIRGCKCDCDVGGYGRDCVPVHLPAVHRCETVPPVLSPTPTPTPTARTLTPTSMTYSISYSNSMGPTVTPPEEPTTSEEGGSTETATMVEPEESDSTATAILSLTVTTEVSELPRDTACPAVTVVVSGTVVAGVLTQEDIRDEGSAERMMMSIALPEGYVWANWEDLGGYVSLVLMSPRQANGFSGPWGNLLGEVVWRRSEAASQTVLQAEVPRYKDYLIGVDEKLDVRVNPLAVHRGCEGTLIGTLVVTAGTAKSLLNAMYVVNTAVSTVATATAVLTGGLGSVLEIQTLGVFATMPCATAFQRDTAGALPYFLSFFAGLGYEWMTAGNLFIAVAFGLLHLGVAALVRQRRAADWASAFATVWFPNVTYLVAYLMHLGIFVPAVMMLAQAGSSVQRYILGVIGVVYGVAFPVVVRHVLAAYSAVSFTKYWQFSKKPFYARWLYPIGYWGPEPRRQMYGSLVTGMKGQYLYWCVFPLVVLCVVGIIASMDPPTDRCQVLYFCMAAVLLAAAVVVGATNMMRSAFLTAAETVSFVLLAVLCIINGVNYLSPSQSGQDAYSAFQLVLMIVLLVVAVYSLVVGFAEMKYWQSLREPKKSQLEALLNSGDADAGDDDYGSQLGYSRTDECDESYGDVLACDDDDGEAPVKEAASDLGDVNLSVHDSDGDATNVSADEAMDAGKSSEVDEDELL